MITLTDFKKLDDLEAEIKKFIIEKCIEYKKAKPFDQDDFYNDEDDLENEFDWYEFDGLYLKVYFREYRTCRSESNQYSYFLPVDIVFEPDFKQKMKTRFDEERERQRLALIEKRIQQSEELKMLAERRKQEKIKMLRELMREFPDVIKEGV